MGVIGDNGGLAGEQGVESRPALSMGGNGDDGGVAGELGSESRPASSIANAALMAGKKECLVNIDSGGANMENSRPVRVCVA